MRSTRVVLMVVGLILTAPGFGQANWQVTKTFPGGRGRRVGLCHRGSRWEPTTTAAVLCP